MSRRWDRWEKGDEPLETCALITTEANSVVGLVHNRMPVILRRDDYNLWLDPAAADRHLRCRDARTAGRLCLRR